MLTSRATEGGGLSNSRDKSIDARKKVAISGSGSAEDKFSAQERSTAGDTDQKSRSVYSCFIDRQESTLQRH